MRLHTDARGRKERALATGQDISKHLTSYRLVRRLDVPSRVRLARLLLRVTFCVLAFDWIVGHLGQQRIDSGARSLGYWFGRWVGTQKRMVTGLNTQFWLINDLVYLSLLVILVGSAAVVLLFKLQAKARRGA